MRRTLRVLVEVTVETREEEEPTFTDHDLAEQIMDADCIPFLVPYDVVVYQTTAWNYAKETR